MVHKYKLNGYNIVLDTASGSVHTVDALAYDIIEMYKTHSLYLTSSVWLVEELGLRRF